MHRLAGDPYARGGPENYPACPCVKTGLGGACQVIIQKTWPWTVVGSVFREYHAPCMLKTFFVDCEYVLAHCIRWNTRLYFQHIFFLSIYLCDFKICQEKEAVFQTPNPSNVADTMRQHVFKIYKKSL
jgi:hypothetical protein